MNIADLPTHSIIAITKQTDDFYVNQTFRKEPEWTKDGAHWEEIDSHCRDCVEYYTDEEVIAGEPVAIALGLETPVNVTYLVVTVPEVPLKRGIEA